MSKEFESTATWKVDITQLKASMQEAKRSITMANSEFKKATAGMDSWSKSTTGVEAKIKQLDTVLEKQKSILKDLNKQYEITAKELGEASPEAERLKIQINNQEAAINKTEKQLKQYNNSLKDLEKAEKEANTPTAKLTKTIEEQQKNVDELKRAYKDSLVGKNPEEAKKLKAELAKASKELKESKDKMTAAEQAADKLARSVSKSGDKAKEAAKGGFTVLKGALANLVSQGISRVASAITDNLEGAIERVDTLNAYSRTMKNLGYATEDVTAAQNKLKEGVQGLPTTLPQIVSMQKQYAALTGDLGKSTDLTLALNNATLASGAGAEEASRAAEHWYKIISAGKPELENWKEINSIMPAQMNQIAESIMGAGKKANDLRDAWKEGTVTTEQVMDALIKLDKEGGGKLASFQQQAQDASGGIGTSLTNIKVAIQTQLANMIEAIGTDKIAAALAKVKEYIGVIGKYVTARIQELMPKIKEIIKVVIDNKDKIVKALAIIAGAIATAFVVKKVFDFITALKGLIKMFQTVITVVKNIILLNPWIALIAGIAAAVAAIVVFVNKAKEARLAQHDLTEEQKKQVQTIKDNKEAYDELNASRNKAMEDTAAEYDYLSRLIKEYNAHVDANGEVKDSYKDRADFILNELAKAFGMEVDEIKKLIDENGKLGESIQEVMNLKRAEALLNANQEAYSTAIKEQTNAYQEYSKAQDLVNERTRSYNEALAKFNAEKEKSGIHQKEYREDLEREEQALNEAREAMHNAEETWKGYNQTILNYEGLGSAIQSKDARKIAEAMATIRYNILTTENADRESLERQYKDFQKMYEDMKKAAQEDGSGVSDAMVEEMGLAVKKAGDQLAKLTPMFEEEGENAGENWADGYKKESKNNQKVGKYGATEANKGAASVNNQFSVTGKTAADKYNSSLLEGKTKAYQNGYIIGNSATGGMGAVNPYPVGTREHTEFANGLLAGKQKAYDSGKELSTQAKLGAAAVSLAGVGLNLAQGLMSGMNGLLGQVSNVAGDLAQSALNSMKQKLGIASPSKRAEKEVGAQIGAGLTKGLLATTDNVMTASADLANTSIDTMADTLGIRSPSTVARDKIGKNIAKGVIDGLNSYQKATRQSLQKNINSWWKQIDDLNRKKAKASDKTAKNNLQKQIDDLNKKIKTAQTDLANLTKNYNSDLMNRAQSRLSDLQKYDRITLEQEVTYWEKIVASLRKGSNGYSKAYSEATGELKLAKRAYSDYLTQKDDDLVSNLNSKISYLQSLDKISVAQEVNYWNKLIKTLKKGTQAYKDAEVALYQAKKNIRTTSQELAATFTESVGTIKKELSDNVQGIKDQLANDIRGLLDTYTDAVLDRKKQLTNAWGSLFSSINLSPKVSSGKLTENLQLQVDALKAYDKTLSSLEKKLGVNSDIVAELRDQGIDSLHTMQSLDEMTTQELKNYVKLYEQRASIAGKRATKENSQLKKDTNAEIAELKKTANAEIKQLQTDANKQIKELTRTFKSGLKELGASVKGTSKDVGTQITAGIKAGISEGMKDLTGSLRTQTKSLVDTVKKQLKIKSPSQVFRDEIGKMMPPGIAQGFTIAMPKAESEMQQALNEAVNGLKSSVAESTSNIIPFNANGVGGIAGSSNTTNNQVVNFNQTINSPKAVDRLTLYRQTNSLLFGAKVRLNNV